MARNKNSNWSVPDGTVSTEQAMLCVLMDIRDELQDIKGKLSAGRWQERAAEDAVRRIDRRLAKRMKLR